MSLEAAFPVARVNQISDTTISILDWMEDMQTATKHEIGYPFAEYRNLVAQISHL